MNTRPEKKKGAARLLGAFGSTWRGFAAAWHGEEAFRQECLLALVVVPLGLWLGETGIERVLLVAPMLLVLGMELLNSGIEAVVDRIGAERHPLSGIAKELGSAAVFVAFAILALAWALILLDRL